MVKRYGNLWEKVISIENITQVYIESRKGKTSKPGVIAVEDRGVDFVGYRTFHDYNLIRTKNKVKMRREMAKLEKKLDPGQDLDEHDRGCLASWGGILSWCDSWRLAKKTTKRVIRKMEARNWMRSPQHQSSVLPSS